MQNGFLGLIMIFEIVLNLFMEKNTVSNLIENNGEIIYSILY